jgi:hypothetical protein
MIPSAALGGNPAAAAPQPASGYAWNDTGLLSCPVEESVSLLPVNGKEQILCAGRCVGCHDHVELEPRPMNFPYIKTPLKYGWPPRHTWVWHAPHRRSWYINTLEALSKPLRVAREEFKRAPCRRGRDVMNLVNGPRTVGQKVGYPTAVNRPVLLRVSEREIGRFTTITMASNKDTS